jgi:hypothetical protein
VLDHLHVSDSEDWDAEIDSMSSTEPQREYSSVAHNQTTQSNYDAEHSDKIKQGHLYHESSSPNNSSSSQKQYFDNEVFPKSSAQSNSKQHSNKETDFSDSQNSCYYEEREMGYNLDITKSDDSTIQPTNVPSERRIVEDILNNFQDSIPHDISSATTSESSVSNANQTFNYENMFHWDFMEKLTNLEAVFTQEDKAKFLGVLNDTLRSTPPYSFLLYLVENHYSNVLEGKKSLAHVSLMQFDKWQSEGLFTEVAPTEMEKDRALWIVTTCKLYLFDLCNKVFKLDSKGNEYLQRHIYYLLQSKKRYKEVSEMIIKLYLLINFSLTNLTAMHPSGEPYSIIFLCLTPDDFIFQSEGTVT